MPLNLEAHIGLDGSGFEAGLKGIERGAERVGETLKGLALASLGVYGIEQAISKTIETATKFDELAQRLGISLQAIQEFGYAAKQSGSDIDALTNFIEKLNTSRIDPKKFGSFEKFGITQPDLANLPVEDLVMKISANVQKRNPQEFVGSLRDIGGKGAGQMINMLTDDLVELREAAHRAGAVMKDEDIIALKFLKDEMETLADVMVAQLAPALVFVMNILIRFINTLKADFGFWQSFLSGASKKDLRTAFDALFHWKHSDEAQAAIDRLQKVFVESGAKSETQLEELNDETDARFAKLLANRQKRPPPEFDIPEAKEHKHGGSKIESDSLLRVGNFLGSAGNPMISIAHTHTHLLRQIAHNTSRKSHGGQEPGSLIFSAASHGFPHT